MTENRRQNAIAVTTPAPTAQPTIGADGAVENRGQATQDSLAAGDTDTQPATPTNWDNCNEGHCDVNRLGKALLTAATTAGTELAAAQRDLGDRFDQFITTRTPWNLAEAHTLIAFAAQAGLQPEGLSAAVAVSLGKMLESAALLGRLYMEELNKGGDDPDEE